MNDNRIQVSYGPWAVVTGASDGIGREMAIEIARRGLNVVLVARRQERLEEVAARISEMGREARVIAADMGARAGRALLISRTTDLDVGMLVAAAGFGTAGPFLETDVDRELNMIEVNCSAVTELVRVFADRFAKRKSASIALFSSIVAFQGVAQQAVYSATKSFNQTFAEALRLELAPAGIDVTAIAPGPVDTGFASRAGMNEGGPSAESVARAAVRALGKRGTVRPGLVAKVLEWSLKLPRWARARIMSLVMGGMVKR